jgi:hypothetical protein
LEATVEQATPSGRDTGGQANPTISKQFSAYSAPAHQPTRAAPQSATTPLPHLALTEPEFWRTENVMAKAINRRQFLTGAIAFGVAGALPGRSATNRGLSHGDAALFVTDSRFVFTPQQFGAHADGTTDDYAAITRADAAAARGKGIVYYPAGSYRTSEPIVPSTGVSHIGAGMHATTITVLPRDFSNFGYSYVFYGFNPDVRVMDLKIDGHKRNGSNPANECGLLAIGTRWHVERVWFYDPNYFGLWIDNVSDSTIRGCRSSLGGNNDTIGGGHSQRIRILDHFWDSTVASNCFDNVNGDDVIIDGGLMLPDRNIYFEGLTRSGVQNLTVLGGDGGGVISLQSDAGYGPATITQPYGCFARNNRFEGGGYIQLLYSYNGFYYDTPTIPGGANRIEGNYIENSLNMGILVTNGNVGATAQSMPDSVSRNVIVNPNASNSASVNTGAGNIHPGGINIAGSSGLRLFGNICVDTRRRHHMLYGIELGATSTAAASTNILCKSNKISGYVTGAVGLTDIGSGVQIRGDRVLAPQSRELERVLNQLNRRELSATGRAERLAAEG